MITIPFLSDIALQIEHRNSPYRWVDLYAAEFVVKGLEDTEKNQAKLVARIVCELSYASSKGKVCLSLSEFASLVEPEVLGREFGLLSIVELINDESPAKCQKVTKPLVLHDGCLYLCRYWNLKLEFENWLNERLKLPFTLEKDLIEQIRPRIISLFALEGQRDLNWQAVASAHALLQNTTFIAGGPGTGKTTTAASLLFLVDSSLQLRFGRSAKLRLLAPTGKAAVRLADSIKHQLKRIESELPLSHTEIALSSVLPSNGETIHRYLIAHNALPSQRKVEMPSAEALFIGSAAKSKTDADILIVDESSMIDLALMVALVKTIPQETQIIFMGDPFQLPPVEPGEVFSEQVKHFDQIAYREEFVEKVCMLTGYNASLFGKTEPHVLDKPLCYLRKTYRFGGDLKQAADQINAGDFKAFADTFKTSSAHDGREKSVKWHSIETHINQFEDVVSHIVNAYEGYFSAVLNGSSLEVLEDCFSQFQLLCTTHEGEQGVSSVNDIIERRLLSGLGYKDVYDTAAFLYHGKPVLVTKNHPELGVFNGDVGFVIKDEQSVSKYKMFLPQGNGEAVVVSPLRLKSWLPAFAMTVHKSQGSEYLNVGLLLADYAKELLSRPLLYTGLTRAKDGCEIWSSEEALMKAFVTL